MCQSEEGDRGWDYLGEEDGGDEEVNFFNRVDQEDLSTCYNESTNTNNYMTKEQELELIAQAQAGDERAKVIIIDKYMRLCHKLARKFAFTASSFNHDDLVQEGIIGLLQALKTYRSDRGAVFMTWAYYHVRGSIAGAGRSDRRQPRYPKSVEDCPRAYNVEDPTQRIVVKEELPPTLVEKLIKECAGGFHTKRAKVVLDRFGLLGRDQLRNCEAAEKYGITKYAVNSHTSSFKRRVREKFPELAHFI